MGCAPCLKLVNFRLGRRERPLAFREFVPRDIVRGLNRLLPLILSRNFF
jgi:hypothetical protein